MIYTVYPYKDTTIYQHSNKLNAGIDEILELTKHVKTPEINGINNSRILLNFDIATFKSESAIPTVATLKLFTANVSGIINDYNVRLAPIGAAYKDWTMGTGKTIHNPPSEDGASWAYSDDALGAWTAGNPEALNFVDIPKLVTDSTDISSNVIGAYNMHSGSNDISLVAYRHGQEASSKSYGSISYFSNETHTIYRPKLNLEWDDSTYATGSGSVLASKNIVMSVYDAKSTYNQGERTKLYINPIDVRPVKSYSTSAKVELANVLPETAYYCVTDTVANTIVWDYSTIGTKISCDATDGSNFDLWTDTLLKNREYSISIMVNDRSFVGQVEYFENVHTFKVV